MYKALHVPTLKLVAVKVIRIYDKTKRHQLVRELKSLHANAVSISDEGRMTCHALVTEKRLGVSVQAAGWLL